MSKKQVIVTRYDAEWPLEFCKIRDYLLTALQGCVLAIEHVGSTSVPGLAAKPVIDVDVVINDYDVFEEAKARLKGLGYTHRGDLGITDRHAFDYDRLPRLMRHHLYVCPQHSHELRRHLAFRDYLRAHPADRDWYAGVKLLAAARHPLDIDGYMAAKAPCIGEILRRCGAETL